MRILPLDPALSGMVHWDALEDSLFEGLVELNSTQIAIVWRDPDNFSAGDKWSYGQAMDVFGRVAGALAIPRLTGGIVIHLDIYVLQI